VADLEAAADAALASVKEFEDHVGETRDALEQLAEQAQRTQNQVAADWSTLEASLNAFIKAMEGQRTESDQDGERAAQALGELTVALGGARTEGEPELLGARDELLGFGQKVDSAAPPVTAMGEDLRVLAQSVADRAAQVEVELNQALQEARDFLGVQMVEDLHGIAEALRQRGAALETMVADQCVAALDEAYQDFETKVGELEQLVEQMSFTDTENHVREVVEFSINEYRQGQSDAFDVLAGNVKDLEQELLNLKEAVAQRQADTATDKDALDQDAQLVEGLAADMDAALGAVKALMAGYTFVSF
jgi:hypothetical protein